MPKGEVHTEKVSFCIYTSDPGCLGYPAWIDHPPTECRYEDVDCQFCDCGGNDVYGEMYHTEDCPRNLTPDAADGANAPRPGWLGNINGLGADPDVP